MQTDFLLKTDGARRLYEFAGLNEILIQRKI